MKTLLRSAVVTAGLLAREVVAQVPSGCCATAAMLRFSCSQLVIERLDPLVSPGIVGSPHNHQIVGGNSFNATMTPVDYDPSKESSCTSCSFSEDFSNYWTANMYFRARNGTYRRVPQMVNLGLKGEGGITVYYIPPYDGKTKVTAFKPVRRPAEEHGMMRICCSYSLGLSHACWRPRPSCRRRNATPDLPSMLQQHAAGSLWRGALHRERHRGLTFEDVWWWHQVHHHFPNVRENLVQVVFQLEANSA